MTSKRDVESVERLRDAQRIARMGHWTWHVEDDRVETSEGFDLIMPDVEGLEGMDTILAPIHPDHRERFREALEGLEAAGDPRSVEYMVIHDDAPLSWHETRLVPVFDDADELVQVHATTQDVTTRREAEESLKLAQRIGKLGHWSWHVPTDEVEWSQEQYRLFGVDAEEEPLDMDSFMERVHPEDRDRVGARLEEALETGEFPTFEFRAVRPDGSVRWMQADGQIRTDGEGHPIEVTGTTLDITEQKEAQRELERERSRLEDAQRVAGVGSWEWDVRSDTMTFTDEKYRLLGLEPGEPANPSLDELLELVHPEDRDRVEANRKQVVEEEEYSTIEWRTNPERGPVRWLREEGEVVTEDGEPVLVRGTAQDITERKEHSEALEEAKEAAEQASKLKSSFLANMSHEIRTPMNAIVGMAGLLKDTQLDEEQQDYVRTIRSSSDHLLNIINDILDLSKIEAGHLQLEESAFDVRKAVEDSLDLLAGPASEKNLEMACYIDWEVPTGLVGDVGRLRQVTVNLLSNAVKFTDEGEVTVAVTWDEDEEMLHIEVRDTGPGIPEDRQDELFDAFSQLDSSTSREHGGTGLGLAISRRLCELMGGTIDLESAAGEGSTFRATIHGDPTEPPTPVDRPKGLLTGARVLIVDNNQANRTILSKQVASWGMEPTVVASGQAALDVLEDETFDVVLMDLDMPSMSGLDAVDAMREAGIETPTVLLPTMGSRAKAAGHDVAAVVNKPVKPSHLFDTLAEVLGYEAPDQDEAEISAGPIADQAPMRILVAEDNAVNQRVILKMLERLGYDADAVGNGEETVQAVRDAPYDLILMDVQMPEMDGYEATGVIQEEHGEDAPQIVALTAHAGAEHRELALDAGMDEHVTKPLEAATLRELLLRVGGTTRARNEAKAQSQG